MTWDHIEGHWRQLTGKSLQVWGRWADDEPCRFRGRREVLAGKLQVRRGVCREIARRSRPLAGIGPLRVR